MIAIIDYGVGNLYSVEKAVAAVGADVLVTGDAKDLESADKLILPGVGSFGDCMKNLESAGLIPTLLEQIEKKKPIMGICVGLQILFDGSEESPNVKGLGIFKGVVRKIQTDGLKIPHMGWNYVKVGRGRNAKVQDSKFMAGLGLTPYFYFVHSYHAEPADDNVIIGRTFYGEEVTAAIEFENIFATQFHPEKSGDVGLKVLKNFVS